MSKKTKQCSTSSPAAELIASNVDLLTKILIRVPAKSLIKFKSVSKQWLSLISDSGFARNHTHQNPAPLPSGLYFYCDQSPEYSLNGQIARISLDAHPQTTLPGFSFLDGSGPGTDITVRRSSNGLILCSSGYYNNVLTICNPTTQKFVVLPTLTAMSKSYIGFETYLVFDPQKSPFYKVVVVSYSNNLNTSKFDVYSSESGSWKSTTLAPRIRHGGIIHEAVWDGAIIEMSCVENRDGCANHDHWYSRFNVDEEKLTSTRVSSNHDTNLFGWILYFGECGGQLLLIQTPREATEFRVLEMIDEKTNFRWTVKYVVDLTPPLILLYRSVINVMNVGENENGHAIMLYIQGKVLQYDIKCNTLKVLWEFPGGDLLTMIPYRLCHFEPSYRFIESLAPV